jgi:hypothetical protein
MIRKGTLVQLKGNHDGAVAKVLSFRREDGNTWARTAPHLGSWHSEPAGFMFLSSLKRATPVAIARHQRRLDSARVR